jgi:CheY-like chemotaxis protein
MSECHVLIVDDDEDTRDALMAALDGAGLCLEQANDGTSGLERIARGDIDVVLLDMHLPDMSGTDFLERLAAMPAVDTRPVMLTADSRVRLIDYASGAKLLHKPVSIDELEEAVKEACAA